jgi:hypothetical protein
LLRRLQKVLVQPVQTTPPRGDADARRTTAAAWPRPRDEAPVEGEGLQPRPAREYIGRGGPGRPLLWVMLVLVVLSPVGLIGGYDRARAAASPAEGRSAGSVFVLSAGMFTVGAIGGVWLILAQSVRVRVAPDGLVYRSAGGAVACGWGDIEEQRWEERPRRGGPSPLEPTRLYHLRCRDGRRLALDDRISEFEALVGHVQHESSRCQLAGLIQRLRAGEVLHFGPFAATPAGVVYDGMTLGWPDVTGADDGSGFVSLSRRGAWLTWGNVPRARVPNGHLLVALARQAVRRPWWRTELSEGARATARSADGSGPASGDGPSAVKR